MNELPLNAVAVESPFMTAREAAAYARRNYETVRRALVEYQRSKGKRGLKGFQAKAYKQYLLCREDVDRWIAGEPPTRGRRPPRSQLNRMSAATTAEVETRTHPEKERVDPEATQQDLLFDLLGRLSRLAAPVDCSVQIVINVGTLSALDGVIGQ